MLPPYLACLALDIGSYARKQALFIMLECASGFCSEVDSLLRFDVRSKGSVVMSALLRKELRLPTQPKLRTHYIPYMTPESMG